MGERPYGSGLVRRVHRIIRFLRSGTGKIREFIERFDRYADELTCDFQRFYHIRILDASTAVREHGVAWLARLLGGLESYDGSIYRERLLNDMPPKQGDDGEPRLSNHGYSQDTMLLNVINTQLQLLVQTFVRDRNDKPIVTPVFFKPPGLEPQPEVNPDASYEDMKRWMMGG